MTRTPRGRLFLVPWHIGHRGDITLRALAAVRTIRTLVSPEPERLRCQLERAYGVACGGKRFLALEQSRPERLLPELSAVLAREDVALVSGSGTPCLADAGASLVRAARAAGVKVVALAGASILSAMLSASGIEWSDNEGSFSFCFYGDSPEPSPRMKAALARGENVVVLIRRGSAVRFWRLMRCLAGLGLRSRLVQAHVNVTRPGEAVLEKTCGQWLSAGRSALDWSRAREVAVIVLGSGC